MNKKGLLITLIVLLIVLGIAAALYPKLSAGMQTQQIATMPAATAEPTQAQTEVTEAATEAATEPTEPEPIPAPDFAVQDWDGNEVHFSDYLGKPIVLNFWAHWCGPCQMEMPEFNAAYERLGGEVTFLMVHEGAAVDDGKEKSPKATTLSLWFSTWTAVQAICMALPLSLPPSSSIRMETCRPITWAQWMRNCSNRELILFIRKIKW